MYFTKSNREGSFWTKQGFYLAIVIGVMLLLPIVKADLEPENTATHHYKMLSTIEYAGQGQFRSQVETIFQVQKQYLSDEKVKYLISSKDVEVSEGNLKSVENPSIKPISFIVDRNTRQLSGLKGDMAFWGKVTNLSVQASKMVTGNSVGQTWKQPVDLSSLGGSAPKELNFTMTAIKVNVAAFGDMIAVRALSEPFAFNVSGKKESENLAQGRINAVYLFDSEIEDVYLSITVFESTTNMNSSKETLRHEIATYKTNADGVSIDLSGLSGQFEQFVAKLGLASQSLKITKQTSLPEWARSDGLHVAQIANVCAATVCEGALNPVAAVCIPATQTVGLQCSEALLGAAATGAAEAAAGQSIFQHIASNWGWNLPTAAVVGGTTVGTVAAAGGFSSGGSSSTVASP